MVDKGNYTVNPEANSKHNNPIWIQAAVLTATRVGGRERGEERSGGSDKVNGSMKKDSGAMWKMVHKGEERRRKDVGRTNCSELAERTKVKEKTGEMTHLAWHGKSWWMWSREEVTELSLAQSRTNGSAALSECPFNSMTQMSVTTVAWLALSYSSLLYMKVWQVCLASTQWSVMTEFNYTSAALKHYIHTQTDKMTTNHQAKLHTGCVSCTVAVWRVQWCVLYLTG